MKEKKIIVYHRRALPSPCPSLFPRAFPSIIFAFIFRVFFLPFGFSKPQVFAGVMYLGSVNYLASLLLITSFDANLARTLILMGPTVTPQLILAVESLVAAWKCALVDALGGVCPAVLR